MHLRATEGDEIALRTAAGTLDITSGGECHSFLGDFDANRMWWLRTPVVIAYGTFAISCLQGNHSEASGNHLSDNDLASSLGRTSRPVRLRSLAMINLVSKVRRQASMLHKN